MIATLEDRSPNLLRELRASREAGQVPLVMDARWSTSQRSAVITAASGAEVPVAAAWATLTSGSSGSPRIVLRSAESWERSFAAVTRFLDAGPEDSILLPAPPSASLTLFSLAHALENGPTPVLGPASTRRPPGPGSTRW